MLLWRYIGFLWRNGKLLLVLLLAATKNKIEAEPNIVPGTGSAKVKVFETEIEVGTKAGQTETVNETQTSIGLKTNSQPLRSQKSISPEKRPNPFARGGMPTEGNLRLLCRTHNTWSARGYFGKTAVKRKLRQNTI